MASDLGHAEAESGRIEPLGLVGVGDDGDRRVAACLYPAARQELADGGELAREMPGPPRLAGVLRTTVRIAASRTSAPPAVGGADGLDADAAGGAWRLLFIEHLHGEALAGRRRAESLLRLWCSRSAVARRD